MKHKQAIGTRLEEFLAEDKQNMEQVTSVVFDESKQKDLVLEDEEEDFLDDGNVFVQRSWKMIPIFKSNNYTIKI